MFPIGSVTMSDPLPTTARENPASSSPFAPSPSASLPDAGLASGSPAAGVPAFARAMDGSQPITPGTVEPVSPPPPLDGPFDLNELQRAAMTDLAALAAGLGVKNLPPRARHPLVCELVRAMVSRGIKVSAEGILEMGTEPFGFLRWPEFNFLACPEDLYVPADAGPAVRSARGSSGPRHGPRSEGQGEIHGGRPRHRDRGHSGRAVGAHRRLSICSRRSFPTNASFWKARATTSRRPGPSIWSPRSGKASAD